MRSFLVRKINNFTKTLSLRAKVPNTYGTRLYLLKEVYEYLSTLSERRHAGLYRDDGLIYLEHANGPLISKVEKALHRIFKKNQLKISMEQKGHTVNFLDVTISTDGSHKPYKKPNSSLKYVNKASNHPPSIPRNIPSSIQKRLNTISSSEEKFNEAKSTYQQALGDAGYSEELTYNTVPQTTSGSTRRWRRTIVWYNPHTVRMLQQVSGKNSSNFAAAFPKATPATFNLQQEHSKVVLLLHYKYGQHSQGSQRQNTTKRRQEG